MTPEFKSKWVAALRSGKYQQGRGVLRNGDKFCCLGVACDLIDPDAWERDNGYSPSGGPMAPDNGYGTGDEMAWQGLNTETVDLPFIGISDAKALSAMNDRQSSFEEIADYIEAHVT